FEPTTQTPWPLWTMAFPRILLPIPQKATPDSVLAAMVLPAPGVVPPMTLLTSNMSVNATPVLLLPRDLPSLPVVGVPVASVPVRLPLMMLPLFGSLGLPLLQATIPPLGPLLGVPLPEITLLVMVLLTAPERKIPPARLPGVALPLPRALLPKTSV